MSFADRLRLLCPSHSRPRDKRKGFRCICVELNQAFNYGLKSFRRR